MSAPGLRTTEDRTRRGAATPTGMSTAERLACEREARHDVAARRRVTDLAPVQHYLAHQRCVDGAQRSNRPAEQRRPARPQESTVPAALRDWLRWGEEGRLGTPVIPPG